VDSNLFRFVIQSHSFCSVPVSYLMFMQSVNAKFSLLVFADFAKLSNWSTVKDQCEGSRLCSRGVTKFCLSKTMCLLTGHAVMGRLLRWTCDH